MYKASLSVLVGQSVCLSKCMFAHALSQANGSLQQGHLQQQSRHGNATQAVQQMWTNSTERVANNCRRKMGTTATVWFQAVQEPCCPLLHSPSPAEAAPAMTSLTVMMGYRMLLLLKSAAPSPLLNLRQAIEIFQNIESQLLMIRPK